MDMRADSKIYDLFIIGGGINGVGIAADAAGRGLKVFLCEKNDLASGTSGYSSKLIHGGLRYLQYYDFKLVKESLNEQSALLKNASQLVKPLTFVLPYQSKGYSQWKIHLGLIIYDHLTCKRGLPKSKKISLAEHSLGDPLKSNFKIGFSYSDCYADDARLVLLNALQARLHEANIVTHTEFISAKRDDNYWEITTKNRTHNKIKNLKAKVLINATGPWVNETAKILNIPLKEQLCLVKGSHIVVPRLFEGEQAYILRNDDGRVIFVIPFEENYHLIGTTDLFYDAIPDTAKIDQQEVQYLQNAVNQYFKMDIKNYPIVWAYSGVRALINKRSYSPSTISRDYSLELNTQKAPLINIIGGKLTTFRSLAEKTVNLLKPFFTNMKPAWTKNALLPGGDINHNFDAFFQQLKVDFPFIDEITLARYARNYGSRAYLFLKDKNSLAKLGHDFGHGLYESEIDYLLDEEWARTTDDILWRRTKLGLHFSDAQIDILKKRLSDRRF